MRNKRKRETNRRQVTSCSLLFNFIILYYFLLIFSLAAFFHVTATTATRPKFLIPSAIFVSLRFLSFVMIMILRPCPRSMAHTNTDTHKLTRAHTRTRTPSRLLFAALPNSFSFAGIASKRKHDRLTREHTTSV